jgi:hypothetical protein
MRAMTSEAIHAAIEQHVAIWNEHDEERFLAHWRAIAPGGVTMGTCPPPRRSPGEICWAPRRPLETRW